MNHAHFSEICEAVAQALEIEATHINDRCSFQIDGIEMLLDFDDNQDSGTLFCYVDLGEVSLRDRTRACALLSNLNFDACGVHGAYGFDSHSARAIFFSCIRNSETLEESHIADLLRFYVEETAEARQMIIHPEFYDLATPNQFNNSLLSISLA